MRAVQENIQLRSFCIDRAIARSIQQDRGWIFSRTAPTVEVSKLFFYYMALYVKWEKGHARAKSKTIAKKNKLVKLLYSTFHRILTEFWTVFQEKDEVFSRI